MQLRLILIFALLAVLGLQACGGEDGDSDRPVSAVATTPHAAELLRAVGGDRVGVTQLLPSNSDPHEFEPRPSDATALGDADLVVGSGGDLDEWLDQLVESAGGDAQRLTLLDHVRAIDVDGEPDPHWWHDPRNAIAAVGAIRAQLIEVDPDGRATYDRNAERYVGELRELDRAIATCLAPVPAAERLLVTSHDAFTYFADRYDIEVVGAVIPALSTQAQASAGETADLIELIRDTGVNAIFPEAGVSPELEERVAEEAGVEIGPELWADTLGPEGSGAETYIAATRANAEALVEAFSDGRNTCAFP